MQGDHYKERKRKEALFYYNSLQRRGGRFQRMSKGTQDIITDRIPKAVHSTITTAVRQMIELSLTSSKYILPIKVEESWSFEEREKEVRKVINRYKTTARIEGAGTGAGGVILGMADFPLLLSIKMKCLFEIGRIYGFDVTAFSERVFLLQIFSATFSSGETRIHLWEEIRNWNQVTGAIDDVNWRVLQQEYRDHIDLVKMIQLLPGVGAFVGAIINGKFLEQLGTAAMNAYRIRMLT
ncbi:EcsC protein family protein [Terribacillus aidingensis]|uniref:EcsC protein family protein n=1 Tax=Terribacillus aidingensis TaxID=586416 RepID=A0A285NY07_9BACI|nr:EcsC family protein [Terribacillus aidingensis]SNZ14370.1 EcsC protein family protein [Terribacillus aidingensis]